MYRSRLQKLEEKKNLRKATLLSLGTILLIALAIIFGIPFLIRMAAFFGDLSASNRPIDRNDTIPPPAPQLFLPYEATNSAIQTITGSTEPGATVFLTLNGDSAGDVVASGDGSFSFSGIRLSSGDNLLAAVAVDQAGNRSVGSSNLSVYFSSQAPDLDIELPVDHQQIDGSTTEVKGSVSVGSRLSVNDRSIIVNSEGRFTANLNLNPGENVLVFIATDRVGNQTRKEITVISNQ